MDSELEALHRAQVERWNDPATHEGAQARSDRVRVPTAKVIAQLRSMGRAPKIEQRIFWLREAARTWGDAVAPHAACKPHCAGCCHQSVMVSEPEAKMIARETGAAYTEPAHWRGAEPALEFTGKPCTFLAGDQCSIYEFRPFACRVLFNMDRDALLCQITHESVQVPYANATPLNMAYVQAHIDLKTIRHETIEAAASELHWSDLRDFFPRGKA